MTKTQKIIDFLLENNYQEVQSPSRKYRKFVTPGRVHALWVGKAAAFRSGPIASNTIDATHLLPASLR